MLEQVEGSQAVARTVGLCRPEVVSAYPISPQTHIVEALADMVRAGTLAPCEYLMVESEFSALSACIGASAAGARTYTATSSQGLLFMAEAVFNASGLGLPIVMTVANRAVGAPINIWNDHSDTMAMRDSGWIQLYAGSNQEAADLHVQAYRIAETQGLPVMVCMDGFVLTHAFERVDVPEQERVDAYLSACRPATLLDLGEPITVGSMVGPEAFTEVKYLLHEKLGRALLEVTGAAADFRLAFGRDSGGLVRPYRLQDAETVVVALGSVLGTIQDVVDAMREGGEPVGALGITCFRPWPCSAVRDALREAKRVVVVERSFAAGVGSIVGRETSRSLSGLPAQVYEAVAGLGGRAVTGRTLRRLLDDVLAGLLEPETLQFLDLDTSLVERNETTRGSR